MSRHFSPSPRFVLLLGFALSLFGLSLGVFPGAQAATSYSFKILDVPGATTTVTRSINDSGQVTGFYYDGFGDHGFVYGNGTFTTFDMPPGATDIGPASINASGQVTGTYFTFSTGSKFQPIHGFIYSNGTFMTIDVPGAFSTAPTSINDSSQVAGTYSFRGSSGGHGFVYGNGTFTTLDVPGATGTVLASIQRSFPYQDTFEDVGRLLDRCTAAVEGPTGKWRAP